MSDVPDLAPGCYGSVFGFRREDMVCKACQFREGCQVMQSANLELLQERMGLKARRPKVEPKPAPKPERRPLHPAVVRMLGDVDLATAETMTRAGQNPWDKRRPALLIATHLLLKGSEFSGASLANALLSKSCYNEEREAQEQARMAILVLMFLGVAVSKDGLITRTF
jgi:hypothetical protein